MTEKQIADNNNQDKSRPEPVRESYFAGANSADGFINYFGEIFRPENFKKLYIIKGGPGTGKSYLMKKIAGEAEARGLEVKYFHCSSSPDSLDGIIAGSNEFAVIDGTSPHMTDPKYPGALDTIINLGDLWDSGKLGRRRAEIMEMTGLKNECFNSAYRYLNAYAVLGKELENLLAPCVNTQKMRAAAERAVSDLPAGRAFAGVTRAERSIGMKGEYNFQSFRGKCRRGYLISDLHGTSDLFLREVLDISKRKQWEVECSYLPAEPKRLCGLFIKNHGISFTAEEGRPPKGGHETYINMERFIFSDKLAERKLKIKQIKRCREELFGYAAACLAEAGSYHDKIEKIYINVMDFPAKEKMTDKIIKNIFQ